MCENLDECLARNALKLERVSEEATACCDQVITFRLKTLELTEASFVVLLPQPSTGE